MSEKEEVVRIEGAISKDGISGKVVLGTDAPSLLSRLFPEHDAKSRITAALADRIVKKIEAGEPMDETDAAFTRSMLKGEAAKWVRRKEIADRALRAHEDNTRQLPAASQDDPAPARSTTSQDWINRFWEDASFVDDELLQEAYARVLAGEAHKAGSCSMRTLQMLRSLDRSTAENFARILPFLLDFHTLPDDVKSLEPFGITHGIVRDLEEAGLIGSSPVMRTLTQDDVFFRVGRRVVRVQQGKGRQIAGHSLSRAGMELSRVAEPVRPPGHFEPMLAYVVEWVNRPVLGKPPFILDSPKPVVSWAETPGENWAGPIDQLEWHNT